MKLHNFIRDDDGDIDVFQLDIGYHNGPKCQDCGASFCQHCYPERMDEACLPSASFRETHDDSKLNGYALE